MRPFFQGMIFALAFIVGMFIGDVKGLNTKNRDLADFAKRCTADGGVLTIEADSKNIYYNCKTFPVQVEAPGPVEECVGERQVIHKLIREDYKRMVTGL